METDITQHRYLQKIESELDMNFIDYIQEYIEEGNTNSQNLGLEIEHFAVDDKGNQIGFNEVTALIEEIADKIKGNRIPILLADDTSVEEMHKYIEVLRIKNIFIKGIDMQNSVEIDKSKQKYVTLNDNNTKYQAKVRKSEVLLKDWKRFIEENANKYFNGRDVNEMD